MASAQTHLKIVVNKAKARHAINNAENLPQALEAKVGGIVGKANALGAGYRTEKYPRDHRSPAVGGTQPKYTGDVQRGKKGPIGLVHPENYAAMKDNHLHNTLLKSI